MKTLYEKKGVLFAVLWIIAYCVLLTPLRGQLGDDSVWCAVAMLAIAVAATIFILRSGLARAIGLTTMPEHARLCLYFIPMLVLTTGNLWGGFALRYRGLGLLWAALHMLLVGYVEEVIFRGFLFRALLKRRGPKVAIIISAVTFGIGHIINVFAGQTDLETLMQVPFAIAWGFMLTMAYYKGGSLLPCILVHALVDVFSVFGADNYTASWIYIGATIVVALAYCPYLVRVETASNQRL